IIVNGDLSSVTPNDGVFSQTPGQFPNLSFQGGSYFRDVYFTPVPTYSVSGTVSPSSSVAGTTLALSGDATGTTGVDSNGNYSFGTLLNGNYTITPSKFGYTFSPPFAQVTVNNGSITMVNFTMTAIPTYTASGTVSPSGIGSGTLLTLTGTATAST